VDKIVDELQKILRTKAEKENERFSCEYAGNESIQLFCDLNEKGRQMRGMLILLTYYCSTQNLEATKQRALPLAVAVEFLETSLLIQDDVIDIGRKRREMPTIHESLQTGFGMERNDAWVVAHMMGMCGITYAVRLLQEFDGMVRDTFYEMLRDTIHGEALDMIAPSHDIKRKFSSDQREDLISAIAVWKTAVYSFEVPMYLGYLLSGGTEREWFRTIGKELGWMFQMKNDLKALENVRTGFDMTDISPYRLTASNAVAFRIEKRLEGLVLQMDKSCEEHRAIREQYPYNDIKKELGDKISEHWKTASGLFKSELCPFKNGEFELLKNYIESLFE
jgi:geranylgeranyl pyrophosphate synthase